MQASYLFMPCGWANLLAPPSTAAVMGACCMRLGTLLMYMFETMSASSSCSSGNAISLGIAGE